MRLAEEHRRQFAWRGWPRVLAALPPLQGQTVLDLGWEFRRADLRALPDLGVEAVREEFLGCLGRADHRSTAGVHCCAAALGAQ